MTSYDITNPLKHRRVIFDGITNKTPIGIDPGETVSGVELADHVVKFLQSSENDLQVKPADAHIKTRSADPVARKDMNK